MRTRYIPFSISKENHLKLSQICSCGIFSKGLKNEFETTVVNEPSLFEPLKLYCNNQNEVPGNPDLVPTHLPLSV